LLSCMLTFLQPNKVTLCSLFFWYFSLYFISMCGAFPYTFNQFLRDCALRQSCSHVNKLKKSYVVWSAPLISIDTCIIYIMKNLKACIIEGFSSLYY
jgi:hypothetical protein